MCIGPFQILFETHLKNKMKTRQVVFWKYFPIGIHLNFSVSTCAADALYKSNLVNIINSNIREEAIAYA